MLSSVIDDNYFSTMGIPVVRGRALMPADKANAPLVAVANEELAKRYWPGQEVIGKRFRMNGRTGPFAEIVGVAKAAKYTWIAETPQPYLYLPLRQHPQNQMTLVTRTSSDPAKLIPALRKIVQDLDSNQPVYNVRTMEDFYRKQAIDTPILLTEVIAALWTDRVRAGHGGFIRAGRLLCFAAHTRDRRAGRSRSRPQDDPENGVK